MFHHNGERRPQKRAGEIRIPVPRQRQKRRLLEAVPEIPNPDLSCMPSNDVSRPCEHLIIGDFGVWLEVHAHVEVTARVHLAVHHRP